MAVRLTDITLRMTPGTHFCWRLSRLQGHSAAGRIRSIEKSNDHIGNRTRYLPACRIVPQPTTLPRSLSPSRESTFTWEILKYLASPNRSAEVLLLAVCKVQTCVRSGGDSRAGLTDEVRDTQNSASRTEDEHCRGSCCVVMNTKSRAQIECHRVIPKFVYVGFHTYRR
jgi:hypothetical protein